MPVYSSQEKNSSFQLTYFSICVSVSFCMFDPSPFIREVRVHTLQYLICIWYPRLKGLEMVTESLPQFVISLFIFQALQLREPMNIFSCVASTISVLYGLGKKYQEMSLFWVVKDWCLVLLQVSKCFVPAQIFWASLKIWLHLVPLQKLLCWHKNNFTDWHKMFAIATICKWIFGHGQAQKIWTAQNILGPVKGLRISNPYPRSAYRINFPNEYCHKSRTQ